MQGIQKLYQNLGKLFYAVAASDKVVREEEKNALKNIVKEEWLDVDDFKDEYGSDAAYLIEIIFDWLDENEPSAFSAFNDFKDFKKDHEEFFTPGINKLIWKTADQIASSFSGKNKSELIMLSELKAIL
ncbi:hypothetical protein ACKGJN_07955 [Gillisia sp. Q332]|uniref:hypothetical protein n=1 Tax=Gillisia xinjiangensis TaxID=3384765 RepID=UPI00391C74C2